MFRLEVMDTQPLITILSLTCCQKRARHEPILLTWEFGWGQLTLGQWMGEGKDESVEWLAVCLVVGWVDWWELEKVVMMVAG